MLRRDVIALIGGAVAAWPLAARAQQKAMPVIGVLGTGSPVPSASFVAAFRQGLSETGYVEGQNLAIEYRWAEGHYDRLPALAADLVGRKVDVIVSIGGTPTALAAKSATSTIPIVFPSGEDPVATGLVASLARPGGNLTGVSIIVRRADAKAARAAFRAGSPGQGDRSAGEPEQSDCRAHDPRRAGSGAREGGAAPILKAGTESEIDAAFATLVQMQAGALVVGADPFLSSRRERSWHWQRAMPFRRSMRGANSLLPAA